MTPYLIAGGVVAGVVAIGIAYAAGRDHGLASGRAECEARIAEGRSITDRALRAAEDDKARLRADLTTAREIANGLRSAPRPACLLRPADRDGVRSIRIPGSGPAPGPAR